MNCSLSNVITKHWLTSISVGSGADAVALSMGASHGASSLQLNLIISDGSQDVVLDIFCIGPLGNLA